MLFHRIPRQVQSFGDFRVTLTVQPAPKKHFPPKRGHFVEKFDETLQSLFIDHDLVRQRRVSAMIQVQRLGQCPTMATEVVAHDVPSYGSRRCGQIFDRLATGKQQQPNQTFLQQILAQAFVPDVAR